MTDALTPVVFVDTETTGLDYDKHEVWEIAIIEANGTEHLLYPEIMHLEDASPDALRITRYWERRRDEPFVTSSQRPRMGSVRFPISRKVVAERVAELTPGKHLVGAVPSFDAAFLWNLMQDVGVVPAWHYHLVDVEALAAGWLAGQASDPAAHAYAPPWDSDELARQLGIERLDGKHTALGDARWAKAIYERVFGLDR